MDDGYEPKILKRKYKRKTNKVITVTKALRTNQKREIGQGRFSIATLVHWNGAEAVMKTPAQDSAWIFVEELMYLRHLRGAGGSPIAFGLCPNPPALFISFVGHQTLENYLQEKRTDEELVEVAIDLCIKIQEIHQKKVIHHDLKEDNVLVDAQGKVHVIDFGNASMEGEECCYRRASWSSMWMDPEVFSVVLSHPTQDVYSVGYLLKTIAEVMESP
ncbi:serine/threonine-protein kinase STY46-like [Penaeus monodon]|uniref:serine/threonine-protein kinase STY46-like n=1 Tax=Penaeus monodon TaxID=6687 RepID=UPI0018A72105|nr:serine/threonine-protein kinase STY46-like [Penaeus monodon]